jgi:hypothetical protein
MGLPITAAHPPINRIAMTSIAESRADRANNVQSGLALAATNCPIKGSMRVTIRS